MRQAGIPGAAAGSAADELGEAAQDLRLVARRGGGIEAMVERAGGERIDAKLARRGDVIAREVGNGTGLGVCIGALAAFVAEDGLRFVDFTQGSCWRF